MKTESRFLLGAGSFGVFIGVVYWFLAYENAGFVLLSFMGIASAFIGGYLLYRTYRWQRAEDDPDAEHSKVAGETVGRFSSGSIWPLVMGIGLVIGVEGFVYGYWLLGFGLVLFAWAGVGLMLESQD